MPMISQVLKTEDEAKVKEQFLKMVHSLFLQVFEICLSSFLGQMIPDHQGPSGLDNNR